MLSALRCPSCADFLEPRVRQCCRGHSVCAACCQRRPAACPVCSAPYSQAASLCVDGVLRAVRLPCAYRPAGCRRALTAERRRPHQYTCPFR